jgi:predicted GH43/DUF377 family glycosyl hydrolase
LNRTVGLLAVLLVIALGLAALSFSYLLVESAGKPQTVTSYVTETTTVMGVQVSRITTTTTATVISYTASSCTVSGPTQGVLLQVLQGVGGGNQSFVPVADAEVSGLDLGYCNGSPQVIVFNSTATNGTGWVRLLYGGFGTYYISVRLANIGYSVTVLTQPLSIAYVKFNISNGNTTTRYCEFC